MAILSFTFEKRTKVEQHDTGGNAVKQTSTRIQLVWPSTAGLPPSDLPLPSGLQPSPAVSRRPLAMAPG